MYLNKHITTRNREDVRSFPHLYNNTRVYGKNCVRDSITVAILSSTHFVFEAS